MAYPSAASLDLDTEPWYRQGWPWLLMLMPAIALVGGLVTFWLAATSNHALVVDDYYSQGKAINLQLARDRLAVAAGLAATLTDEPGGVTVRLSANDGVALPATVSLRVMHATRAELDRVTSLARTGAGVYQHPDLHLPVGGRWRVQIEDDQHRWRLVTSTDGFDHPVRLQAEP